MHVLQAVMENCDKIQVPVISCMLSRNAYLVKKKKKKGLTIITDEQVCLVFLLTATKHDLLLERREQILTFLCV